MDNIYERRTDESTKAYEAFCVYRDLGAKRSTYKVAEELSKSEQLIRRWCAKYEWEKRCSAWDAEQDKIARQRQMQEILEMRVRHAKIAQTALEKVSDALAAVDPEQMSNADISRLMDVASKLERLSRGDTSEVIEERDGGEAVNPVQIYIPSNTREKKDDFDDLKV